MRGFSIHIGVNDAPYSSKEPLSSAENDANALFNFFSSLDDYQANNPLLTNNGTTTQFVNQLDSLVDSDVDRIVISFSGHGTTIDGIESICLYDRPMGEKELFSILNEKFFDKNVRITLILDSCHSGGVWSIDEGIAPSQIEYQSRYLNEKLINIPVDINKDWIRDKDKNLADFNTKIVLLAACEAHDDSWGRRNGLGVFTKALLDCALDDFVGDYVDLICKSRSKISSFIEHPPKYQKPQLFASKQYLFSQNPF